LAEEEVARLDDEAAGHEREASINLDLEGEGSEDH
jgi:hypothetical protein